MESVETWTSLKIINQLFTSLVLCQASNEELWGAGIHVKTGQGEGSGVGRGFKARTVDRSILYFSKV